METIRYARISKEDLNLGTGTFEVRLADGRVVVLEQVDLGEILSDASLSTQNVTLATLTVTTLNATTVTPPTTLRLPEKADPASPLSGELWINSGGLVPEYADDAATPAGHVLVAADTTQTLTNKTLTSPTISGPTFSGTLIGTFTIGGTPSLGVALDAAGQDITALDEVAFSDAVANPTLVGRLRRNGTNLLYHNGLQAEVIVLRDATQTLTGKTLTAPVIATIVNTGTLTLPTSTDTLVGKATTDTFTNKTFDAQGTGNSLTNVSTISLKTATGSSSTSGISANVTMNDYSFFPSLTNDTSGGELVNEFGGVADPGNTVGRIRMSATAGTSTIRWRYVTASDDPTVWIAYDPITGDLKATWTSDDPTLNDEPGVRVAGMTSEKFKAQALTGLAIAQQHLQAADARIAARHLNPAHRLYRAMQVLANDDAPSGWLLANCKIQLPAKRLIMK